MPRMVQGSCGHQIAVDDNFQGSAAMCGYCNQMVGIGGAGPAQSGAAAMGGYAATAGYAPGYAGGAAPGKGMAVAGGVLAIILGALWVIAALAMLLLGSKMGGLGQLQDMVVVIGVVLLALGGIVVTGGAMACAGRPGWTLTTAIIMSVFTLLGLIGLAGGGASGGGIFGLLITGLSATFCFMGYGQAKRLRAWKQSGGR